MSHRTQGKRYKRDDIFDWICEYADEHHGNSPSLSEIGFQFSIHRQTAYFHILKLIRDGKVRYEDGKLIVDRSEWIRPSDYPY